MNAIADWALANIITYGPPMLLFISYIGSLGIPFPITLVIMAAGAFTRAGLLDWQQAVLACLIGAMLADNSEYLLGRLAYRWLKQRFGEKIVWQQAQSIIDRQGGWAILLTRFWLTPLAPEINMIAGSRYPFAQFLFLDFLGQFLWVLLYGGAGYVFTAQWESISQAAGIFSGLSVVLFSFVIGIYYLVRRRKTALETNLFPRK